MANRLTRIVTRTGDDGTTGLGDGTRLPKHHARIDALGQVDELNACLGLLSLALNGPDTRDAWHAVQEVQHDLFELGSELAVPGYCLLRDTALERLDHEISTWNQALGPLQEFILPGGCAAAAHAHVARTVCRRAERAVVAVREGAEHAVVAVSEGTEQAEKPVGAAPEQAASPVSALSALPQRYLNRLSDWLFVLARHLNRQAGVADTLWNRARGD